MTTKQFSVKVTNPQGVLDGCSLPTKLAVQQWLDGWYDVEGLDAVVTDESGVEVGYKPSGRNRIVWGPGRVARMKQRTFDESVKALFKP